MQKIKLTQCRFSAVDDDVFELANRLKWCASQNRNKWYAHSTVKRNGKHATIKLHQYVFQLKGFPIPEMIDHIDGDGLNNQWANLRGVTNAQNQGNQRHHLDNFVGVRLRGQRWQADIRINRRLLHIGRFDTAIEAALARDQYIVDHGLADEYALNFPEAFAEQCASR